MGKQKVLYVLGPEDIFDAYKGFRQNSESSEQTSIPFSRQFFEVCSDLGIEGYAIAKKSPKLYLNEGNLKIEQRPNQLGNLKGFLWHLSHVFYGFKIVFSALFYKATEVIVASGTTHWFVLGILYFFNIRVIADMHCTLWLKHIPL